MTITLDGTNGVTTAGITLGSTAIASTAAEINILDGVTATATELNLIDGVTSTTAELNILDGVTSTAAELNILDGVTSTAAELNILDGVTATAAEINLIDGGATIGTTALADGDGMLINDAGTMRVSTVQTVKTYMTAGTGAPAGTLIYHAANAAPTGYLKANGATISRSTYSALFSAIGTTFGAGDGSSTFLVPDLRGEFLRAWDDGRGVDGSRSFGSAQADQMEAHAHITGHLNHVSHTRTYGGSAASGSSGTGGSSTDRYAAITSTVGGTGNSSETRPRNIALLACIKF